MTVRHVLGAAGLEQGRRCTVIQMLERSARRTPNATALALGDRSLTFDELDLRAARVAAALHERGVGPGDKVALAAYNCLEIIETWFGVQKLGAVVVPVNFRLRPAEVAYILEDSGAIAIISDAELDDVARTAAEASPLVRAHLSIGPAGLSGEPYEAALEAAGDWPPVDVGEEDLAFLMYTSGTTGLPKGAMLTHRNLWANTVNWVIEMGAGPRDVWLSGLPLFHIGGINGILPFILTGGTSVLTASTGFDAAESLRLMRDHRATMCYFVPTQWLELCRSAAGANVDTSVLRVGMWGASPAPLPTLELMSATFPNLGIVSTFGMTEMSSNTCALRPEHATTKMGSVGTPFINVEARIVDDEMRDVSPGEIGEIVYRGPTVMRGYHGRPEANEEAFAGGWFHSGDLCRQDEDGFVYVVDRKKDMIVSGGENVYPAEIERCLIDHPAIREVSVIGVPHPRWVETPLACVVPVEGANLDEADVIEFCKDRLASYKKPTAVRVIDVLPRNAGGKVLKRQLKERFGDGCAGAPAASGTA